MQSPHIEQIDAYLLKQLSPEAQVAFEQALEDDASLAEALKLHLESLGAIRQKAFQNEIAATNLETEEEAFLAKEAKTRPLGSMRMFLIATSIALIAMLSWWGIAASQNAAEDLFAAHFYTPVASDLLIGGAQTPADSLPTPLVVGLQSYQKAEYTDAIESFRQVPLNRLTAFERSRLYLLSGIGFLIDAQYDSSRIYFAKADMHTQSADWYLALSYLRAQDVDKAQRLLNPIAEDDTHEFQLLAQKLLLDME